MAFELYVDGGVTTKNPSPFGGTWAFIIIKPDLSIYQSGYGAFRPGVFGLNTVTNNQTEMYAMLRGLQAVPGNCDKLTIFSDSMVTIGRVSMGWKWTNIPIELHIQYQALIQSLQCGEKILSFHFWMAIRPPPNLRMGAANVAIPSPCTINGATRNAGKPEKCSCT